MIKINNNNNNNNIIIIITFIWVSNVSSAFTLIGDTFQARFERVFVSFCSGDVKENELFKSRDSI